LTGATASLDEISSAKDCITDSCHSSYQYIELFYNDESTQDYPTYTDPTYPTYTDPTYPSYPAYIYQNSSDYGYNYSFYNYNYGSNYSYDSNYSYIPGSGGYYYIYYSYPAECLCISNTQADNVQVRILREASTNSATTLSTVMQTTGAPTNTGETSGSTKTTANGESSPAPTTTESHMETASGTSMLQTTSLGGMTKKPAWKILSVLL
jgi:hypothetical protein